MGSDYGWLGSVFGMDLLDERAATTSEMGVLGLFSIGIGSFDIGDSRIVQQKEVWFE